MKYYDYYDFSDEISIMLRLYKERKNECEKLNDEIKQIKNENVKLERRRSVLGQTTEDEIERRKIQKSIDSNENNIEEKKGKIESIMKPVNEAIKKAEKKFVDKIEEKNEKIKDSETNVKVVEQQLEKCRTQIKEIEEKHELTETLKLAMLRGLKEQEDEYVNLYEEFCKKSENLLEEKNEINAMKEALDRSEFEKLESYCKLIEKQIKDEHSTVQQTAETPEQEAQEQRTAETPSQQVNETPETTNNSKIIIGRKGKIIIDGKKYKISKEIIKEGVSLTSEEKMKMLLKDERCRKYLRERSEEERNTILKNLDGAVVNAIAGIRAYKKDLPKVHDLMYEYITSIENAKQGKKRKIDVKYNMKDLAKIGIFGRISNKEIDEDEKFIIRRFAKKYERYGIADIVGKYKRGILSSILGKIMVEPQLKLASRDDEQVVAEVYNKLMDEGNTNKVDDEKFLKNIKVQVKSNENNRDQSEVKYNAIENTTQLREIRELHRTLTKRDGEERDIND